MPKILILVVNSFGFNSICEFLNTSLRYTHLKITIPIAMFITLVSETLHEVFGLTGPLFYALLTLFILELISGVWASRVKLRAYKDMLKNPDLAEGERLNCMCRVRQYSFSSRRFSRAGAVMGFWLIIIYILWQFAHFENSEVLSAIFYSIHVLFISYIVGIYLISVLENIIALSKNGSDFKLLRGIFDRLVKPDK